MPRLNVSVDGQGRVLVWWPVTGTPCSLEWSGALGALGQWTDFGGEAVVSGDRNIVTIDLGNAPPVSFFRLAQAAQGEGGP